VFIQSAVPAHAQLAYLLECTAYVGELARMVQYKEKGRGKPMTRGSLFTYPCLMAADILLYGAHRVPVGGDQDQHVELARDLAIRFNRTYGQTFVVPELQRATTAGSVRDLLTPTAKMSKSDPDEAGGVLRILDSPDVLRRKVMRAVTDSDAKVRHDAVDQARRHEPAGDSRRLHRHTTCRGGRALHVIRGPQGRHRRCRRGSAGTRAVQVCRARGRPGQRRQAALQPAATGLSHSRSPSWTPRCAPSV